MTIKFKETFIIDVDFTICKTEKVNGKYDYKNAKPIKSVINKINKLYDEGNRIVLYTARNMKTYNNDIEKIHKYTKPILVEWLNKHNIKYHELYFGKIGFWDTNTYYIGDENLTINQFINRIDYQKCVKENCKE